MSSRGRRYDGEPKLNIKKVIAVIIVLAVIIMCIALIIKFAKKEGNTDTKVVSNSYMSAYSNGKWGVINSKGEAVILPNYDEMILVPDPSKPVFICTSDVNIENGTYNSFAINNEGKKLFESYEKVEALQNMDTNGVVFYDTNALKVYKNGKYGLINLTGKELLSPEYDSINPLNKIKNSLLTVKDGKYGLVDNSGNSIIDNLYTEITALTNKYEDGYIVKNEDGKYGIINYNKKQVLECKYDEIKNVYGSNMYVVKEAGKVKVIDSNGNTKLESGFDEIVSIDSSNIVIKRNSKYGVVNSLGETKIEPTYEYLEYTFDGNYIAKKDGKYGIVNLSNETKVDFSYVNMIYMKDENFIKAEREDFKTDLIDNNLSVKVTGTISEINSSKGYIKVRENGEYNYYNFKLEKKNAVEIFTSNTLFLAKKDGKYGYADKNGNVIIDYIYDDATEQNDYGYVAVKSGGVWGALDQNGKNVISPSYKLEQNTIISFVGKWHLAPDLNANYYTDENE